MAKSHSTPSANINIFYTIYLLTNAVILRICLLLHRIYFAATLTLCLTVSLPLTNIFRSPNSLSNQQFTWNTFLRFIRIILKMIAATLTVMALTGLSSAQSSVSLFLPGTDNNGNLVASVVGTVNPPKFLY